MDVHSLIRVNVDQFFGIEIEEFPAQIAQVALWLVDHQMNLRVSVEFGLYFARVPLISSPQIRHGNALRLDWNEVLPAERCSYVLGNPPFLGKTYQSKEQKTDLAAVMQGIHGAGDLDFVCGWYVLAAQYMQWRTGTQAAFVSTNSITQGEQVAVLWGEIQRLGMHTHFAHRTFQWSNEASGKAAVHCVIVGFGPENQAVKTIYEYEDIKGLPHAVPVKRINAYLVDAPDVFLHKRTTPVCNVSPMANGGKATDGGNLLLSDEEKAELIAAEPKAAKWIRPFLMGDEFINSIGRWCLWLVNIPPAELRAMPHVLKRVEGVRAMREASTKKLQPWRLPTHQPCSVKFGNPNPNAIWRFQKFLPNAANSSPSAIWTVTSSAATKFSLSTTPHCSLLGCSPARCTTRGCDTPVDG